MSSIERDVVLTTAEAVKYLKISKPTFFRCIRSGKIRATKVGKDWRVLLSELDGFLRNGGNHFTQPAGEVKALDHEDERPCFDVR